jgi:hypothetical protein
MFLHNWGGRHGWTSTRRMVRVHSRFPGSAEVHQPTGPAIPHPGCRRGPRPDRRRLHGGPDRGAPALRGPRSRRCVVAGPAVRDRTRELVVSHVPDPLHERVGRPAGGAMGHNTTLCPIPTAPGRSTRDGTRQPTPSQAGSREAHPGRRWETWTVRDTATSGPAPAAARSGAAAASRSDAAPRQSQGSPPPPPGLDPPGRTSVPGVCQGPGDLIAVGSADLIRSPGGRRTNRSSPPRPPHARGTHTSTDQLPGSGSADLIAGHADARSR